jgi:hypothetical protein
MNDLRVEGAILMACLVFGVMIFFMYGVTYVANDYRLYKDIMAACEKQGYIRDMDTQINCTVVMR